MKKLTPIHYKNSFPEKPNQKPLISSTISSFKGSSSGGGPFSGAVKKTADPYGDGPLKYEALADGFTIRSALVIDGKPVVLRFTRVARSQQSSGESKRRGLVLSVLLLLDGSQKVIGCITIEVGNQLVLQRPSVLEETTS